MIHLFVFFFPLVLSFGEYSTLGDDLKAGFCKSYIDLQEKGAEKRFRYCYVDTTCLIKEILI